MQSTDGGTRVFFSTVRSRKGLKRGGVTVILGNPWEKEAQARTRRESLPSAAGITWRNWHLRQRVGPGMQFRKQTEESLGACTQDCLLLTCDKGVIRHFEKSGLIFH